MSVYDWPADEFIQALIDRGIIDFTNPRPCAQCPTGKVYGNNNRRYCARCSETVIRCSREASRKRGECVDCGATVAKANVRCMDCHKLHLQRKKAA